MATAATSWPERAGEHTIRRRQSTAAEGVPVLYSSWFCPFAQRAWIAMEEKGRDYRWAEINPYKTDPKAPGGFTKQPLPIPEKAKRYPAFIAASPRGLVPAIDNNGEKVNDSLPVVEYIDDVVEGPALLPDHPHQRARVRIWSIFVTERIQKPYYRFLMSQTRDGQATAKEEFFSACRDLAGAMAPAADGPFFLGSQFSMFDIAFAPFWQRFLLVGGHYRGLKLPSAEADPAFARLHAWWDAVSTRPSVAATFVNEERLIASYSQYADGSGTSDYANSLRSSLSDAEAKAKKDATAASPSAAPAASRCAAWPLAGFVFGVAVGAAATKLLARR